MNARIRAGWQTIHSLVCFSTELNTESREIFFPDKETVCDFVVADTVSAAASIKNIVNFIINQIFFPGFSRNARLREIAPPASTGEGFGAFFLTLHCLVI